MSYFPRLACLRNKIHLNLFVSMAFKSGCLLAVDLGTRFRVGSLVSKKLFLSNRICNMLNPLLVISSQVSISSVTCQLSFLLLHYFELGCDLWTDNLTVDGLNLSSYSNSPPNYHESLAQ